MPSLTIQEREGPRGKRYRAVVERWVNGRRRRIYGAWSPWQKKAAEQGKTLLGAAYDQKLGIQLPPTPRSLGELIQNYQAQTLSQMRPATWKNWVAPAIVYLHRVLDDSHPLAEISPSDIQRVLKAMEAQERLLKSGKTKRLRPNTIAAYGRHLSAMFEHARGLKWIPENPCKGLSWPRYTPLGRDIPDAELPKLWRAARARFRPILWLLRHTGMRQGELVNLDRKQVDYKRFLCTIEAHARRGISTGWQPKTAASRRLVRIPKQLMRLLGRSGGAGYVFEGYAPDPVERVNQVSKDMRDACLSAKVGPYRTHDLKHTYCTRYLEDDGSVTKLAAITGTSITTLMRVYAHLVNRVQARDMAPGSIGRPPSG